jgi:hypothetical protein
MKVKSLIALLSLIGFTAIAQPKIGVIVGPSFTNQRWISNGNPLDASVKTGLNFHVGATADIPLSYNFSFQPELFYSFNKQSITQTNTNLYNYNNFTIGYIKMPAMLTYMKDFRNIWWYVGSGPYAARVGNTNTNFEQNDKRINTGSLRVGNDIDDQITPWDLGMRVKAGFELQKGVNIQFFFDQGFKDVNPYYIQTYNRSFGASFVYLFSLNKNDKYNRYPDYYNY